MDYLLGIDPGKTGAYAFISADLKYSFVKDYPNTLHDLVRDLKELLKENKFQCAIERAQSAPRQGLASTFTYGTNYGGWLGVLTSLDIPYITVRPREWQKVVYKHIKRKGDIKQISIEHAARIFPNIKIPKSKDGRSDALNIALYARDYYVR